MMDETIIKDELYGTITLNEIERAIVDTADFQRLRRIKQMALTYLVYPCANHTRFEHSLGTMHVASMIADRLGINKEDKEMLRLYALVHDVGHVAFSHESERVLPKYIGSHEAIGKQKVINGEMGDVLKENYDPRKILALEKTAYGQIVCSDLGADRIDYLRRDAQNTGVAYGVIDSDRIVHTLSMVDEELVIDESGLIAAESLLIARFMMFSSVYFHHTVRIAGAMLCRAIDAAVSSRAVRPEEFLTKGDEEAFLELRRCKEARYYVDRLLNRQLFKEAYSFDVHGAKDIKTRATEIENKLSKKFSCDIIVDWPYEFFKPINLRVRKDGRLIDILKLSDLVCSLKTSEDKRKKVLVLCPPEKRERLRKAFQAENEGMVWPIRLLSE